MGKFQRRHYFVNKKLQLKYILLTVIFLLIYTFLFVCLLLAPYMFSLVSDNPLHEQAHAARMLLNLHNSIWPILGIVILVMSFMTIYISHKVAGPVYRLKSILADVASGNLDVNLNLRKRDDLKDLADDMVVLINDLRTVVHALQDGKAELSVCIDEIEEKMANKQISDDAGNALIEKLVKIKENSSAALAKYHRENK